MTSTIPSSVARAFDARTEMRNARTKYRRAVAPIADTGEFGGDQLIFRRRGNPAPNPPISILIMMIGSVYRPLGDKSPVTKSPQSSAYS